MSTTKPLLTRLIKPQFSRTMSSSTQPLPVLKTYYMLNYKYVDNVVEKRAPFRNEHISIAKKYAESGKIVMGGAFANPIDGAAIVFNVKDKSEVEEFAKNDPYVKGGIVTRWEVREWTVVV